MQNMKPGKPKNITSPYRLISLLLTLGKLFEKLLSKRLQNISETKKIFPTPNSTSQQSVHSYHRLAPLPYAISSSLEQKILLRYIS